MLKTFFISSLRSIRKTKLTSFINILCLTAGMTTAVLIMIWVQNELTFDSYHPNAGRIYRITENSPQNPSNPYSSLLMADAINKEIPTVEKTARLFTSAIYVPGFMLNGERIKEKKFAYVDESWFSMFQHEVIEGSTAAFGKKIFSIILTESSAKKYFGSTSVTGKFIQIDSLQYEVQAVIKNNPANSSFQFKLWLPIAAYLTDPVNKRNDESWYIPNYFTFIQLKEKAAVPSVSRQLTGLLNRNVKNNKREVSLVSLSALHFENNAHSLPEQGNSTSVYIFSILAILILITACINYVTLTTAKAGLRVKEISVRKIIGAKRVHLFAQFMMDSLLVSGIALLFTLLLVQMSLPVFNAITGKTFVITLTSPYLWRVAGATMLFTILVSGLYPALLLSSFNPLGVFRGTNVLTAQKGYFRKCLVVLQFTLSIILIIGTIVIYKQLQFIRQTDNRYNRSQVFAIHLPVQHIWLNYSEAGRENLNHLLKQRLLSHPAVKAVSVGSPVVDVHTNSNYTINWNGNVLNQQKAASLQADAAFKDIMNIELLQGRWFQAGNPFEKKNYVLNETALRQFNIEGPVVGQRLIINRDTGNIIGVVKDFHYSSLRNKISPLIIRQTPGRGFHILVQTTAGQVPEAMQAARTEWNTLLPAFPFDYTFMDEAFNNLYAADKKTSGLVLFFSIITLTISSLGLLGLADFTAKQRTKEIGIRKVLGASVTGITRLLTKDFLKLVLLAYILAVPVAWWTIQQWLEEFAYKVPLSAFLFLATGIIAMVIAGLTVGLQALKAALANPVKSLHTN